MVFPYISNNKDITGDLSDLLRKLNPSSLNYFMAYNCDLYGSLPSNIHFTHVQYFVIHDNRLSCDIPENMILLLFS